MELFIKAGKISEKSSELLLSFYSLFVLITLKSRYSKFYNNPQRNIIIKKRTNILKGKREIMLCKEIEKEIEKIKIEFIKRLSRCQKCFKNIKIYIYV